MYEEPDEHKLEIDRRSLRCKDANLNPIVNDDSEAISPFGSRLTEYVKLLSTKMDLKVFCIIILCITISDSSKASQKVILLFICVIAAIIFCRVIE